MMTEKEVIELAKEVELGDAIDWSNLNIDRDKVYQIMGSQVYEMFNNWEHELDKDTILLATITKLVVENFVLNVRLGGPDGL